MYKCLQSFTNACNHFEALVPRIYELGGKLPADMVEFHNISACPPAKLPADPKDIKAMLEVLVKAEQCAVRGYTKICDLTFAGRCRLSPLESVPQFSGRSPTDTGCRRPAPAG